MELDRLRHELEMSRPSEDEQDISNQARSRIKELKLNLVTLSTRMMEAEENKRNYGMHSEFCWFGLSVASLCSHTTHSIGCVSLANRICCWYCPRRVVHHPDEGG